jgi:hypothetical protein
MKQRYCGRGVLHPVLILMTWRRWSLLCEVILRYSPRRRYRTVSGVGWCTSCRHLEHVDVGTYIELLVPLTGGADNADVVELLRDARGLLREGAVDSAIGQARKALEPLRAYVSQKLFGGR